MALRRRGSATKEKTTKKKSSKSNENQGFVVGLSVEELKKELKKGGGGGGRDPEIIDLYDGDQVTVSIVTKPEEWLTFYQHYDRNGQIGDRGKYHFCSGDGCEGCDAGITRSKKTLVGVYAHRHYKAPNKDYPEKTFKDVGYRFLQMNKNTTETLLRIFERRRGKLDRLLTIERIGSDTDTKYDIEPQDNYVKASILKKNPLDAVDKYKRMLAEYQEDSGGSSKKKSKKDSKSRRDEEQFDYGYDDDDEDEKPRRRTKKSKSSSASGTRKKKRR